MFTQSRIQNPVKHLKAEKCKKMIQEQKANKGSSPNFILSEFKLINSLLSPPRNHQKTYGFLMISGGNRNKLIRLILDAKFRNDPEV